MALYLTMAMVYDDVRVILALFLTDSIEVRLVLIGDSDSTVDGCSLLVVSFRMGYKLALSHLLFESCGMFSMILVDSTAANQITTKKGCKVIDMLKPS